MRYTLIVVQMAVLEREPVGTGRERAEACGEFHLNCSRTGAKFSRRDKFRLGEFQF
jgi:hypothetical protein